MKFPFSVVELRLPELLRLVVVTTITNMTAPMMPKAKVEFEAMLHPSEIRE